MAFTFEERPDSRPATMKDPTIALKYTASGTQDDIFVGNYARAATSLIRSTAFGTLYRQDIKVNPNGFNQWIVEVSYGRLQRETGSYSFTFDTTGGTITIGTSKEHVKTYPVGGDANPHKGSINVKRDGKVEGTTIVSPALKINVQFQHPLGIVTLPFAKTLARATGSTCSVPFLGGHFDAEELLFLGATGGDGTTTDANVSYQFAASENATGLTVGDIVGIVKNGHDLAWVEYKDAVVDDRARAQPEYVHIERVYEKLHWPTLFGWS